MTRKTKKKNNLTLYIGICLFASLVLLAVEQAFTSDNYSLPSAQDITETVRSMEPTPEPPVLNGPYDVLYVIDGDTAFIDIDGVETKVRFVGVDTPESVHQDESRNTPEGKIASQWTKDYLTGKRVYLEYDIEREDEYGRTLAYIYLEDGVTMVQEELLKAGMAQTLTIQPNSKYASRFYQLQVEAREAGAGFWATGFFN